MAEEEGEDKATTGGGYEEKVYLYICFNFIYSFYVSL